MFSTGLRKMENSHCLSKQIKPVGQIKSSVADGRSNFWRNEIWFLLLNWFVAFLCAKYNKQLVSKGQLICMKIKASVGQMTTKLQDSKVCWCRSEVAGYWTWWDAQPDLGTQCSGRDLNALCSRAAVKVSDGSDTLLYLSFEIGTLEPGFGPGSVH